MPKYVNAKSGPKNSVIYTDSDGKQWSFEGGNRPWRNQNPGNLVQGSISKRNGAIGTAGGFAVFPDYESGHAALLYSLKNVYGNKDISGLMKDFAPKESNDTKKYIKFLQKQTGITDDTKIKYFSKSQFEILWKAIEKMEGWGAKIGTIRSLENKAQIIGVHFDEHGIIDSYNIEGYGWVSKDTGIELTEAGKVDAVVCVSSHGHPFLKGRPRHAIS